MSEEESKWTIETAAACIKRTGGKITKKKIVHKKPGIKVLGAIDYLIHYQKFFFKN